jgi:hypothetical protein
VLPGVHMERDEEGLRDCPRPEAFEGIVNVEPALSKASLIVEPTLSKASLMVEPTLLKASFIVEPYA